jgi:hypothetical protein
VRVHDNEPTTPFAPIIAVHQTEQHKAAAPLT